MTTAMKIAAAKLESVYQTHRDRLFNGLPMWPWETWINGLGVAYGALLRYGNWQIGGAYHDNDSDVLLYVSVDLYDLIIGQKKRASSANEFLQKLAARLSEGERGAEPE